MTLASQRPAVRLGEFLRDMRSGLDDAGLMRKHGLSESGLNRVLGELIRRGYISVSQLRERSQIRESQVFRAFLDDQNGFKISD